ncbi:two-component-system connector protein YcgZ, partial [Klebsiella pneumoniae]
TLGQIVMDILNEGRHLNRKALCTKLLSRLDRARAPEEESHYQTLIGLLFAGQE